ncbi:MAG TPA: hypothetical protein VEZ12_00455 [Herpetosiphonaceae bacterium]|nr:hypothetical protein [Herpetosiphonaceae bacterium]
MSPTVAELAVGLIAAILIFMLAVRLIPLVVEWLADYFNLSVDDEYVEKDNDHYES